MAKCARVAFLLFPLLAACATGQPEASSSAGRGLPARDAKSRAAVPQPKRKPAPQPTTPIEDEIGPAESVAAVDPPPDDVLSALAQDLKENPKRLAAMHRGSTPRNPPEPPAKAGAPKVPEAIRWTAAAAEAPVAGAPKPQPNAMAGTAGPTLPDNGIPPGRDRSAGSPAPAPQPPAAESTALVEAIARSLDFHGAGKPIARALAAAAAAITEPARPFDVGAFGGLDDEEKEVATRFHDACQQLGREIAAGKPASEAATALATALMAAKAPDPLLVPKVELCTRVEGFGKLTPIENKRFLPGRAIQVILYTEVDRFASEQNDKGEWATRLATRVAIFAKHDGTEVWSRDWQAVSDASSVKRDDFFICEKVTLNEYLTIGTYILRTSIRDEKTGAMAERSLEFQMVADPTVAAR